MATESAHIYFNDQDALNLWGLRSRALRSVDGIYNAFELDRFRQIGNWVDRAARPPSTEDPAVIHFIGPDKPWHATCPTTPAVSLYRAYLRRARRIAERTGDLSLRVANRAPA
jgi:lipopolysaccharide biosynthesis glycosyltransferase